MLHPGTYTIIRNTDEYLNFRYFLAELYTNDNGNLKYTPIIVADSASELAQLILSYDATIIASFYQAYEQAHKWDDAYNFPLFITSLIASVISEKITIDIY